MIAAVHFKNFKALRSAAVKLGPFNLVIGPNGSGKTSLIQALLSLRDLSARPSAPAHGPNGHPLNGPRIEFHFSPPFQNIRVTLGCTTEHQACNQLMVDRPPGLAGEGQWAELRTRLQTIRAYLFDHSAMIAPVARADDVELAPDAANLSAVLARWQVAAPAALGRLTEEFCRILPEFSGLEFPAAGADRASLRARLAGSDEALPADSLSQGTLYLLAILTLAQAPERPGLICLEEADRGVHPRMLREVRDALYHLSYPPAAAGAPPPVQVITTTHSPYLLDLFREHPEEIVLANKRGNAATFERLSERGDLREMMKETNLGDLWYSGILGGVPGE